MLAPILLSGLTALSFAASPGSASPPAPEHQSAVLINPIGPGIAAVASLTGSPALDANLRAHHMLGDRVGLTVQGDYLRAEVMDVNLMNTSVHVGPRFALRGQGLADWSLSPFGSVGYTTLVAAQDELLHYTTLGLGVDASRTWIWKHFTMEVGLGAYASMAVAYQAEAELLEDLRPPGIFPIKPRVNWSLGYAF